MGGRREEAPLQESAGRKYATQRRIVGQALGVVSDRLTG